ncbi:toll/interleukin-1 receptor domain-containing protein [Longimicrobium terrae]|uniref:TIR domain-containing protein n=1 Tax=Longimicrobium terrae TaxID=1639882 RepID=A0A841GX53_9BACT|nr:toll/interleukin-1 receptor domain-containing protein [Longimicrobium terrae]MBB4635869.1 hypothetical protein [Longimicrobium terrae]MBB6070265.1 hypothetical protein [Longimicrobium terrae]NNC30770.1 toll/interleukin-1 receptor domain-containing protein [Longimicrobium terrae]
MSPSAPLQILLFRHPDDTDVAPYEEAIVGALQGGKAAGGYFTSGEDLGIQLEVFSAAPPDSPAGTLDRVCHTLIVVLVDDSFVDTGDSALWMWLGACWDHVAASDGRHGMQALPMEERIGNRFVARHSALSKLQVRPVQELGERALRPTMLALRTLHDCRVLLAGGLPTVPGHPTGFLRLFISHAKVDGLPLAHALMHQIASMPWLSSFYDARDIREGANWQRELEEGVGSSLIVMLRTDIYDSRHWCQQEVLWSDEYATPAVLVDARTSLHLPANSLPFDRVPTVRIPDGNLMRVIFVALREGLRFLYFVRMVEEMRTDARLPAPVELRVFSYPPGMSALLRACRTLAAVDPATPRYILYPDPPLRAGMYEAAQALVTVHGDGVYLVTPDTLVTMSRP